MSEVSALKFELFGKMTLTINSKAMYKSYWKNEKQKIENEDPIIIKKIENDISVYEKEEQKQEPEYDHEHENGTEEEQILNSVISRLNEM